MIGSVNDSCPPVLVETEAAALDFAMGMVVTRLSLVLDGGMSAVNRSLGGVTGKRAVGVIPPA